MEESNYTILVHQETETAKISLCSDDIVRVTFKKNSDITLEKNTENIRVYGDITKGKMYAFLFDSEGFGINFTKEAREYARSHEDNFPIVCSAIMTRIMAYKLLGEFYLRFHKPNRPTKLFSSIEDATKWCLEMIATNKKETTTLQN